MRRITHRLVHLSPLPRIRVFDRQAGFTNLRRVCRSDAGELRSDVVDDVKISVGAVVLPPSNICTYPPGGSPVPLNQAPESQKTRKGITFPQTFPKLQKTS